MKASAISNALLTLVAARQPVFIWGGPGIGKSAVVRRLADVLGVPLQDVRALLLDPVDLRGLPILGNRWPVEVGNPGVSATGWNGHPVFG